jgi:predicted Na+-dependent transporter
MTVLILLVVKLSVVALILAVGLSASPADVAYLWRRPALLARSLVAMYVVVPAAAFLAVRLVDLPQRVEVALLVLAVSAGAPLLPRKLMRIGHESYMLSLVVTSSAVAVVAVPLWLEVLRPLYGLTTVLRPVDVAALIARSFIGPIALGMLIRWRFPETAEAVANRILAIAGIVLIGCVLVLLILHGHLLLDVGWPALATLIGMTFAALAIGHVLGGPGADDRTGLAVACATRHVGIAMLVAASLPGPGTAVLVTAYLLAAALVSIPYLRWRRRSKPVAA